MISCGLPETFNIIWRDKNGKLITSSVQNNDGKAVIAGGLETVLRNMKTQYFFAGTLTYNLAAIAAKK